MELADLVSQAGRSGAPLVEITGGEPLIHEAFPELVQDLLDQTDRTILVETNGSLDISVIPEGAVTILDVKCPGSGQSQAMDWENLNRLRPGDEIKFVLTDQADYEWARERCETYELIDRPNPVLFMPVFGTLNPTRLAEWILKDRLRVRLGIQWHKYLHIP